MGAALFAAATVGAAAAASPAAALLIPAVRGDKVARLLFRTLRVACWGPAGGPGAAVRAVEVYPFQVAASIWADCTKLRL